jgi:uncharacterized membrane protein YcaP (DUF421 family)
LNLPHRVQNGDDITEIATGLMEPNGQLVLTLKKEEQNASKKDIAGLRGPAQSDRTPD